MVGGRPAVSGGASGADTGAGTVIVGGAGGGGADRPGGRLRAEAAEGATVVTGDSINLECAGRSYTFQPGSDVTIGRDSDCDVVSANPTVSRRHARLAHDGEQWTLEDLGSSGGTYVDGARVDRLPLAGSVAVWLGDEETGERVVLVTSGTHKVGIGTRVAKAPRRKGSLLPVLGGVLVLVVLIAAGFLLLSGGPDDDELAQATVRIVSADATGSGTIIDAEKGLILQGFRRSVRVGATLAISGLSRRHSRKR